MIRAGTISLMRNAEFLTQSSAALAVNREFSEAVISMRDRSQLCFCHRVDERWAKAIATGGGQGETTLAGEVLALISMFRLNRKHLVIEFHDGSRWERQLKDLTQV
jgi:hypothetical protein